MNELLTKTFNVWVNAKSSGYLNLEKWKRCGMRPFPEVAYLPVFVGIDLSLRIDLTSVSFVVVLNEGNYAVLSHSFMPQDALEEKRHADKAPYDVWEKQGWLTIIPGAEVDYHFVLDYILEIYEKYNWTKGSRHLTER